MSKLHHQRGASMVEQLVTVCVASLLALSALPGLEEAKDQRRLDSAVAQLESELQFARSAAVARSETVRVAFASDAQGSCYVVHNGGERQCSCGADGQVQCEAGVEVLRSVGMTRGSGLAWTSSAREIGFDAGRGTVTPTTTLRLESRRGHRVNLVLNIMGRIRSCSPDAGATGYPAC